MYVKMSGCAKCEDVPMGAVPAEAGARVAMDKS